MAGSKKGSFSSKLSGVMMGLVGLSVVVFGVFAVTSKGVNYVFRPNASGKTSLIGILVGVRQAGGCGGNSTNAPYALFDDSKKTGGCTPVMATYEMVSPYFNKKVVVEGRIVNGTMYATNITLASTRTPSPLPVTTPEPSATPTFVPRPTSPVGTPVREL